MKPKIQFTDTAMPHLLEGLGYGIGADGYVTTKSGEFAKDYDNKKFKADKFLGIVKGHLITNTFQLFDIYENEQ